MIGENLETSDLFGGIRKIGSEIKSMVKPETQFVDKKDFGQAVMDKQYEEKKGYDHGFYKKVPGSSIAKGIMAVGMFAPSAKIEAIPAYLIGKNIDNVKIGKDFSMTVQPKKKGGF
jgi:hypothetical protein